MLVCVTHKQQALNCKLVRLARGDIDLVARAVRSVAVNDVADLGDVVDYIVANRAA